MSSVAAAASDAVELEAKRKEDSSWHPCRVSLSSDISAGSGLTVDFGSQEPEDVIYTKEEALERLRIRSIPVQGDECFHIKEGEHVLASQEAKFGTLFFDAKVEKVYRVRHSKRNPCRCIFEIKRLHKLDTITLPATSLKKLSTTTIETHPTVSEFLNTFETFDHSSIVSLLEKQIEEITKFAEVPKKGSPENGLLGMLSISNPVDLTGQVRHRTIASQLSVVDDQKNSRKSTRRTQKENPVSVEPDRFHLSPLGARAALASLMYKLPSEPDFSTATTTTTTTTISAKRTTRLSSEIGDSDDEDEVEFSEEESKLPKNKKRQRRSKKGEMEDEKKKLVLSKTREEPKLRSSPRLRTRSQRS